MFFGPPKLCRATHYNFGQGAQSKKAGRVGGGKIIYSPSLFLPHFCAEKKSISHQKNLSLSSTYHANPDTKSNRISPISTNIFCVHTSITHVHTKWRNTVQKTNPARKSSLTHVGKEERRKSWKIQEICPKYPRFPYTVVQVREKTAKSMLKVASFEVNFPGANL